MHSRSPKRFALAAAVIAALMALPAQAALRRGAQAPQIVSDGALGGRDFHLDLAALLRRGPVVLYFFPKAFTSGCTAEAHAFAEASDDFAALGATVIGMSNDDVPTLRRFSAEACRNKFAVASASPATIRAYDVALGGSGGTAGLANRTSYVIGRDGRIAMVHSEMDWRNHVSQTLAAVRSLRRR